MKLKSPRTRFWLVAALGVVALAVPTVVFAANDFQRDIYNFFGALVLGWLQFLAQFVGMVIHFLIVIAQYNDFVRNDVVTQGWNIVTSVANMFFIIALLVIALGTVLRIQNYRYNRLLGTVIVMAFLVNFSKTIAAFFIQTSQVVMLTFVNAFKDAAFGNFAVMMGLDKVLTFSQTEPKNYSDILVSLLVGLFLLTVAFITIVSLAIVLVFRIVYLWILVILSPLAYALRVLPNTERFAGQWWSEFGKWTTNGPVIAFFIWLALAILSQSGGTATTSGTFITSQPSISTAINAIPPAEKDQYFGISDLMDFNNFTSFIVGIVFLWVGLQQATAVGGMAGKWVEKVTTGGLAAYGALSGLNALRDWAVPPIQGYMRQREQRRQQAISERTATVGRAVDQVAGITTPATRVIAAAGTGIRSKLSGGSFTQGAKAGLAVGTRGEQQRAQRIEAYEKQRAVTRGQELDISNMDLNSALGLASGGSAPERFAAIQRALALNGLEKTNKQHQEHIAWAAKYAGDRQLGSEYRQQVEKLNPDMARKVLYNNFESQADVEKYLEHARGNATSLKLEDKDIKEFRDKFNVDVGSEFVRYARNKEDLEKKNTLLADENAKELAYDKIDVKSLRPEISTRERRDIAQATGQWGRAFYDGFDANGVGKIMGKELNEAARAVGGAVVAKTIAGSALKADDGTVTSLWNGHTYTDEKGEEQTIKGMRFADWKEIRGRGDYHSDTLGEGFGFALRDKETELRKKKPELTEDSVQGEKAWKDIASQIFLAKKGKAMPWDITTEKGREGFRETLAKTKADEMFLMDPTKVKDRKGNVIDKETQRQMLVDIGMEARTNEIADLLTYNHELAKKALETVRDEFEQIREAGTAIEASELNKLKALSKSPIVGKFFNLSTDAGKPFVIKSGKAPSPAKPDKDEDEE